MTQSRIRNRVIVLAITPVFALVALTATAGTEGPIADTVQPFLTQYCASCHGNDAQKGDRRFDRLPKAIGDSNDLVDYQDIVDLLNLDEMPPSDAPQPSDDQRREIVNTLSAKISDFHARQNASTHAVLRRMNSREYRNTVRDLLQLEMLMFDPTIEFPRDQTSEHLDNIGQTLVTSGYLLQRYLDAADQVVTKALYPVEKPETQSWEFSDGFDQQPEIDQVHRRTNKFSHLTLYDVIGADKPEGAYAPIHAFEEGVPVDGFYDLKIHAEALNRQHPYDDDFLGIDSSEPLRLGVVAGHHEVGSLHLSQPVEPLLAEVKLRDQKQWLTVRVWLDAGFTPRFTFRNGLMDARNLWSRLIKKYPDQFPKPEKGGIVENRFNAIKYGKLPQIQIHDVQITGPVIESWPTAAQTTLLGNDFQRVVSNGDLPDADLRSHVRRFASAAYRRTATEPEVDRIWNVIRRRRSDGASQLDAFADGIKVVLCSPNFLYLSPPQEPPTDDTDLQHNLSDEQLATRLSYFLWSSMPDAVLRDAAGNGNLHKPGVLADQVERMLIDKRSNALVDGFLDSWLTLRDLGGTPPDRQDFKEYYHYDLGEAMRRETSLFTRCLIDENLNINQFIDSDFTFVNKPLARMYGMPVPASTGFHRMPVTDRRRGGLLGQASVLTVTANGIDTSPVVRGVWLLENLLGDPPSPPPPDVEPLDPDTRGAKSIRDQLQKHRDVPSCFDCHREIDPLGFALENYDPIGRWRTTYGARIPIDASGELPTGERFDGVVEFKQLLSRQNEKFARALTEKLLAYACGRQLSPLDRPHVDAILADAAESGNGLRDLIKRIVVSEPFLNR